MSSFPLRRLYFDKLSQGRTRPIPISVSQAQKSQENHWVHKARSYTPPLKDTTTILSPSEEAQLQFPFEFDEDECSVETNELDIYEGENAALNYKIAFRFKDQYDLEKNNRQVTKNQKGCIFEMAIQFYQRALELDTGIAFSNRAQYPGVVGSDFLNRAASYLKPRHAKFIKDSLQGIMPATHQSWDQETLNSDEIDFFSCLQKNFKNEPLILVCILSNRNHPDFWQLFARLFKEEKLGESKFYCDLFLSIFSLEEIILKLSSRYKQSRYLSATELEILDALPALVDFLHLSAFDLAHDARPHHEKKNLLNNIRTKCLEWSGSRSMLLSGDLKNVMGNLDDTLGSSKPSNAELGDSFLSSGPSWVQSETSSGPLSENSDIPTSVEGSTSSSGLVFRKMF